MDIQMIYHTPELHKLVEAIARVCYQSYEKLSPTSHSMIKGIMKKGHLSVASSGNMVFKIDLAHTEMDELVDLITDLMNFKEINNFIRWTTPGNKETGADQVLVSMNMLTLIDIVDNIKNFHGNPTVLDAIVKEVKKVPYLHWFLDDTVEVPPSDSPYIGSPRLYDPVILSEDYTALKELGLTYYELNIHSTITVDMVADRATGLQMWRHGDMTGGCELSQRYCDRSSASMRRMVDIDEYPVDGLIKYAKENDLDDITAAEHYQAVVQTIDNHYLNTVNLYSDLNDTLKELGVSAKRAKEIARSILPNAITTRIIQCRPLRQWRHYINLRDTVHAQPEIRKDTEALKEALTKAGVAYE